MYNKILVAFDNSDSSCAALAAALEMADGSPDAQITVLKVVEWQDYNAETFKIASRLSGELGDALDVKAISEVGEEAENEEIQQIRSEIAPIIGDAQCVSLAVANGSPHDTIVAYAEDLGFDVIVMGHRGMGMIRGMLGSVCFSVLQKTNKPVLVVK